MRLQFIGWSIPDKKLKTYFHLARKWNLWKKILQSFYKHSQPHYDVMQQEINKMEFVQAINFEFIDSLKKHRYKELTNL